MSLSSSAGAMVVIHRGVGSPIHKDSAGLVEGRSATLNSGVANRARAACRLALIGGRGRTLKHSVGMIPATLGGPGRSAGPMDPSPVPTGTGRRVLSGQHDFALLTPPRGGCVCSPERCLAALARGGLVVVLTESYWAADRSEPVLESTVGGVLRSTAEAAPERIALVAGMPMLADRRRWTYGDLLVDSEAAARALLERFEPGEHLAVWAPNIPEWVILEFGAGIAGLTLVTVNPAYRPEELAYVLEHSGAAGIVLVPEFRSPMAAYLEEVRPKLPHLREVIFFTEWDAFVRSGPPSARFPEVRSDDIAQIQYTSGTTGFPKGARLHHRGLTNNARFYSQRIGMGPGDVYVNPMPLFHTAGCGMGVLGCAQAQATNVPVVAFDPALVLELIESERSMALAGVPTMFISMLEHPDFERRDLSSIRVAVSGGAPVPAELVRRVEECLGARFSVVFGTTECSPLVTQVDPRDDPEDRATTLGMPLPQTEVCVVDPVERTVVPVGAVGELCARGYLVMAGYHGMPEATAQAIDDDGWYHTGDLASMDERGCLRIEGRVKDMIIRGGENIYPREIEDVLFTHPSVAEAAVVGIPDDHWGEVVAAFVRPTPGATIDGAQLRAYCRERLAPYKTPQHWVALEQFPLTASGKIQKYKLREDFRPTAS